DIALHLARWNICRMLVGIPFPFDRLDALDWIQQREGAEGLSFTIHRERLIGAIDLSPAEEGTLRLGYWLAEDHWGHGFMSEALRAALGRAFELYPERTVMTRVPADACR